MFNLFERAKRDLELNYRHLRTGLPLRLMPFDEWYWRPEVSVGDSKQIRTFSAYTCVYDDEVLIVYRSKLALLISYYFHRPFKRIVHRDTHPELFI